MHVVSPLSPHETCEANESKKTKPTPVEVTVVVTVRSGGSASGAPAWGLRESSTCTSNQHGSGQCNGSQLACYYHRLNLPNQYGCFVNSTHGEVFRDPCKSAPARGILRPPEIETREGHACRRIFQTQTWSAIAGIVEIALRMYR